MDSQRKAVQNLARELDDRRSALTAFYTQFGARLLGDSSDPACAGPSVTAERVGTWKNLMASRESDTKAILDIKAAIARMRDLAHFKKELDRNLEAENARYRESLSSLGRSLYARYDAYEKSIALEFGEAYERVETAGAALARLEEKQERLRRELEDSGFFGQMLVQFRMAGLASSVRQQKARIAAILSSGTERLVARGVLARMADSGELDAEATTRWRAIEEAASRREDLAKRAESLDADQAAIRSDLDIHAASESPARRAEELRLKIRETDKRIDALVALVAREYCDKFMDDDGLSVLGGGADGHSFSDMGSYSRLLEEASHKRAEISLIRRKIEILETGIRIESLERSVVVWKRSREDAERKIESLGAQIAKYDQSVAEAGEEIARLAERREDLERSL